ncbi:phage tail spike protein, partial [Bacillus sp. NPDC077411]|uniref:phage tail spike protein n=1 Tax=Bacillus sp. NPDC077411 TaxID=3363947 RepID=UPI0037C6387D
EMLRQLSKDMYDKQKVDQPKATYKVTFQELSQTEEYKDFAVLQRVYMGDIVTVRHAEDNIDIQAKVNSYKYDPIMEEYIDLTLGNYKELFTDIAGKVDQIHESISGMEESFLDKAKDTATNLINSGFGGHVRVYPERILIMDTKDEMTAKKVWQWNINGLGYSSTGINGQYGLAMTMDGSIVADFITTGKLSASLVQAGFNDYGDNVKLMSDGLHARLNGKKSMVLGSNGVLSIFDNDEKLISKIGHAYKGDNPNIRGTVINSEPGRFISLSFRPENGGPTDYYPYLEMADNAYYGRKGIFAFQPIQMNGNKIVFNANSSGNTNYIQEMSWGNWGWLNTMVSTYGNMLANQDGNGNLSAVAATIGKLFVVFNNFRANLGVAVGTAEKSEDCGMYQVVDNSVMVTSKESVRLGKTDGSGKVSTYFQVNGSEAAMWANFDMNGWELRNVGRLNVTGSKNAIHVTRDGVRATPAYETAESYLGDIGSSKTDEDGQVIIPIEELFSDTVNTSIEYQVFLTSYCSSHVWVSAREEEYFVVNSSEPNASFAWELKAKRRGFESDRLVLQDEYDNEQIKKVFTDIKADDLEGCEKI